MIGALQASWVRKETTVMIGCLRQMEGYNESNRRIQETRITKEQQVWPETEGQSDYHKMHGCTSPEL